MATSLFDISFDAHNAAELAAFWAQALRRTVNDGQWIGLVDPEGNEFDLVTG